MALSRYLNTTLFEHTVLSDRHLQSILAGDSNITFRDLTVDDTGVRATGNRARKLKAGLVICICFQGVECDLFGARTSIRRGPLLS